MIGKFYESFGKEKDETQELPKEVIDILNGMLPDNFIYLPDGSGRYRAVPRPDKVLDGIKLTTQFAFDEEKDADVIEKLKKIPRNKWDEYFYRTQRRVPIKNAKIGNEEKVIPIEELSRDPLSDNEALFTDGFMQAYAFPEPITMTFESPEGDVVEIGIQQQAYDSLVEIKFLNVDFPALKIELYQYSPLVEDTDEKDAEDAHTNINNQLVANYSVTPSKAKNVKDAIIALHLFRGLYNGTTKVDDHIISPEGGKGKFDPKRIEDALAFWETASKIEEKLNIQCDPEADCPEEDIRFFTELQTCLLDGKAIVWRHPFDHFHVGGFHPVEEGMSFEDFIGNESIRYEFLEGPISATLLGTKFEIYSRTEMKDFAITNIEWDDESHEKAEVYISDVPNKQWTLTRLYMTKEQAEEFRERIDAAKRSEKA